LAIEILIGILVGLLAVATTIAAVVGLAGLVGVVRLGRCQHCNRLGVTSGPEPLMSCLNCRHERVLHPIAVRHRPGTAAPADRQLPRHA
jgi:hypothetical protein